MDLAYPLVAELAVALHDGRAVAIRAGNEEDVLGADAVAQEAREEISGNKDAADVPEVQVLVAVGHARRYDGAAWPRGARVRGWRSWPCARSSLDAEGGDCRGRCARARRARRLRTRRYRPPHIIAQVPVRASTLVDMRRIGDIHTFEDRALQRWMTRASFAVLGATAALSVGLMVALGACAPEALDRPLAGVLGIAPLSWFSLCGWFVVFAAVTFALLAVHELVHAAFFKLFAPRGVHITFGANWKAGMLYACAEGHRLHPPPVPRDRARTERGGDGCGAYRRDCGGLSCACGRARRRAPVRLHGPTGIMCGPSSATRPSRTARTPRGACVSSGRGRIRAPTTLTIGGRCVTRLLLHACCAPCSLEPVRLLEAEGFEPSICWTNPNIQPADEHDRAPRRAQALVRGRGHPAHRGRRGHRTLGGARGAHWGRSGARCAAGPCYALRLAEACRVAVDEGFTHIATTLAVSPYQLFDTCNDVLECLARAHGLTPVVRDFRPWYPEATRRSRELGMYRQNYCGCRFSGSRGRARPRPPARRAPAPIA